MFQRNMNWILFEKEAEKIENQDFQIIRDPSEVQKLHLKWLGQQKMKF